MHTKSYFSSVMYIIFRYLPTNTHCTSNKCLCLLSFIKPFAGGEHKIIFQQMKLCFFLLIRYANQFIGGRVYSKTAWRSCDILRKRPFCRQGETREHSIRLRLITCREHRPPFLSLAADTWQVIPLNQKENDLMRHVRFRCIVFKCVIGIRLHLFWRGRRMLQARQ